MAPCNDQTMCKASIFRSRAGRALSAIRLVSDYDSKDDSYLCSFGQPPSFATAEPDAYSDRWKLARHLVGSATAARVPRLGLPPRSAT
eukprot:1493875-Rhodomonas_salina.1